jgi:two-component system, cell cycle sensor histidine kinase and response regulator CckA
VSRRSEQSEILNEPHSLRILFLEDDSSDAELTIRKLKQSGIQFQIDVCSSAEDFKEHALSRKYDIILGDYRLPRWTGLEAVRWLRSNGMTTPFVLVTGTLGDELAIECIKAGADDYILKENLERLPVAVRRALEEAKVLRERDQIEDEKRRADEQYRLLFQSNPHPMWVFDRSTLTFLAVNEAALRHYGYTRQEFSQMTILDIRPSEDVETVLRSALRNRAHGLQFPEVWRHRLKSGTIIDVEITSHDLIFDGKEAELILANDITEKKKNLERLRQSEERFSKVFQANPLPITIATRDEGRYLDVNDAFLTMMEYGRDEVVGHTSKELNFWIDTTSREAMVHQLDQSNPVTALELELRQRSGKIKVVQIAADLIPLNGIVCILSILRDVTEARHLEQQFRQAQKMEAVGELAGGLAHDFNNMLSVVSGYSDLALEELDPESPVRRRIVQIKSAAQRSAALTRQLLAFSRRQVLQPTILDLNTVVAALKDMLRRVISEDISLTIVPAHSLDLVRADRGQIEQALMNLVVNARDAMPNGGEIAIETMNVELDEIYAYAHPAVVPGRYVMLSLSDTGCGMDKSILSRIFEPFYTTKPPGKGTGLGLSMVYGVVRQSGGHIVAYSEPEKGTNFRIYLPRAAGAPETRTQTEAPAQYVKGSESILLVEDEQVLRGLTAELLESEGYKVVPAQNAQAAISIMSEPGVSIDLLLTDVILPGISGTELVSLLRASRPNLKVLYMSGYAGTQIARHGVLEAEAFVEKPFTKASLLGHVRKVLGGAE